MQIGNTEDPCVSDTQDPAIHKNKMSWISEGRLEVVFQAGNTEQLSQQ